MTQQGRRCRKVAGLISIAALAACSPASPSLQYTPASTAESTTSVPALSYRLIHNFGRGGDGGTPVAGLVSLGGKLYGTTEYGGRGGNGTVFRVGRDGIETIVHSFGRVPDGENPVAGLIAIGKALYGTTETGGKYNLGTVFVIRNNGGEHVLHSFGSGNDGAKPLAGLVAIRRGVHVELYGTTSVGGEYALGAVFRIATSGRPEEVIHSFGSGSDGSAPDAGLVAGSGALYGTTSAGGGPSNDGTVFSITTAGKESVLIAFDCNDGKDPVARLSTLSGTIYGTTEMGGNSCTTEYGTVFSVSSGDTLRTVYSFGASPDGESPMAGLIPLRGVLYGTTESGGTYGYGTLFSVSPAGKENILHSFGSQTDGAYPVAAPLHAFGSLYGTTRAGGKYGGGTVYAFTR
jgi:uncharacterized repeat protein (TIGR03803 family)